MQNRLVDNELFVDFDAVSSKYDSEGRYLSNNQVAFFSKSMCRAEDSSLLVVYHASQKDFDSFDSRRIGSGGGNIFGNGFYFCDSDFGLNIYGEHIREFYLNLKNPFIWNEDLDEQNIHNFINVLKYNNFNVSAELLKDIEEDVFKNDGGLDTVIEITCGTDFIQKYLINAGYDGIMNMSVGDYVAFYPEQIKLCSNKEPAMSANIAA